MYEYQNEFLYNKILAEDAAEEGIETEGDAILHQFYCGNWTQTMAHCVDNRIEPKDFMFGLIENFSLNIVTHIGQKKVRQF